MKKQFLSILLAIVMVLGMLPVTAVTAAEADVASVSVDGVTTAYANIDDAIDAAEAASGDVTLTLLENISCGWNICEINGGTFTVDLNGKEWVGMLQPLAINDGTITITDSSAAQTGRFASSASASLEVLSGSATIIGGIFDSPMISKSELIIHGGTINNEVCVQGGSTTITGGTINGRVAAYGGTVSITGGTINGGQYGVYVAEDSFSHGGAVTISGGTITGTTESVYITDSPSDSFVGSITITGGTFNKDPNKYVADDYKATLNSATNMYEITVANPQASVTVDGVTIAYADIGDAIDAAEAAGGEVTLTLQKDINGNYAVESGAFTIDLNGKEWTTENSDLPALTVSGGKITFTDSGTDGFIRSKTCLLVAAGGEVLITAGSFLGIGMSNIGILTVEEGGKLTLTGGQFGCDPILSDYVAEGYCIVVGSYYTVVPSYNITVTYDADAAEVTAPHSAGVGETVRISAAPKSGFVFGSAVITDGSGNQIEFTQYLSDGVTTLSFAMPEGDIEISLRFGYGIWIAGIQLSADNPVIDSSDNAAISGTATYDPANLTLTLNDFRYNGGGYDADGCESCIYAVGALNILLQGENAITNVTIVPDSDCVSIGIYVEGSLTIGGEGSLTATGGTTEDTSCGIHAYDITITGVEVTAIGTGAGKTSFGIQAWENITINGSKITAIGTEAGEASAGLYSEESLEITDSEVIAIGSTTGELSLGIYANDIITIACSEVTATAGEGEMSIGMYGGNGAVISGGHMIVEGKTCALYETALHLESFTEPYQWRTDKNGAFSTEAVMYNDETYFEIGTIRNITVADSITGGSVSADSTALEGDEVTITITPEEGKEVDSVTVKDEDGNELEITKNDDGTYTYEQPAGDVTIEVTFKRTIEACLREEDCPMSVFTDVDKNAFYHDGTHFCLERGLMNGIDATTFAPAIVTNRAMIVTILWRLENQPVVDYEMTFQDVEPNRWYTEAVRWAASKGIVNGYSAEIFDPAGIITREQLVAILYRYEQSNGGGFTGDWSVPMDYDDMDEVASWAYEPMCWMSMHGIVKGKTDRLLVPKGSALRAELATMVYRYYVASGK